MTQSVPVSPDENSPPSTGRSKRRLLRFVVLLTVCGGFIFWQRQWVIGQPLLGIAKYHLQNRDHETAVWWTALARRIAPGDPNVALFEAKVARHQGDMQSVASALKKAADLGASRAGLERQQLLALAQSGQMRQAEPHLAALLTEDNQDNKEVCEAFVVGYIRNHRIEAAQALLNPWIADAPNDATPRLLRARIQKLVGLAKEAEADFLAAIDLQPTWSEPRLELAELLVDRKRFADATIYFRQLLAEDHAAVRAKIGLAECLIAEGDPDGGEDLLRQACAHDANSVSAHQALGRALVESGKYEAAISILVHALELRPHDDESHYLLGQAYSLNGQADRADEHFQLVAAARTALEELDRINASLLVDPDDAAKLIRAGEILISYGDSSEGVLRVISGLDLEPTNAEGLKLLADYYTEKAETDPAFRDLATEYRKRFTNARESDGS